MTVELRAAARDDIEFLASVVFLGVRARYRARPGWDPDAFYRGLVDDAADQVAGGPENSTTYVIVDNGIDVGRLRVVTTTRYIEIAGLQVHPDHQNRGIGTAVITSIQERARADGLPVALEVETDNPDAKRLYERLGFIPAATVTSDRLGMICQPSPRR